MLIGYLRPKGCEFFHLTKSILSKLNQSDLSKKRYIFDSRVVILSRELLHVTKKVYPVLNMRELRQVISYDLEELSPYKNYGYYYKITNSSTTNLEVTFWFWEIDPLNQLIKEGFNFKYVIPEDLIFKSKEETLFIDFRDGKIYLLFSKENYIISSYSSLPPEDSLKIFLRTIRDEIKHVVIYGDNDASLESLIKTLIPNSAIERKRYFDDLPKFLKTINLREFKSTKKAFEEKRLLIVPLRLSIYVALAFSLYFYLSAINYERERLFLQSEIQRLSAGQVKGAQQNLQVNGTPRTSINATTPSEALSLIQKERPKSVLTLLDKITSVLPEGSYINSFELMGNTLTLQIYTNASLQLVRGLREVFSFGKVKLLSMVPENPEKNLTPLNLEIILDYEK